MEYDLITVAETEPLYLLTLFGKSEKTDLSKAERNILAKAVKRLVKNWRSGK